MSNDSIYHSMNGSMVANGGVVIGLPGQDETVVPPDATFFRNGVEPRDTDVFIAVMGVTGSGKSSFISLLAEPGQHVPIGDKLQSCTQDVDSYLYKHDDDTNVYLIDTPGFDDTNRDDSDVLRDIALWLSESIKSKVQLSGMFYLHRIADPRMQGTAKKNLLMFKKLCGENALKNVILVTTMWDKVKEPEGVAREKELKETEDFWGYMVRNGSRVERHLNNQESAKQLVSKLLKQNKIKLTIQDEMVRDKIDLNQTLAGQTLDKELASEREKWQKLAVQQKADWDEAMRLRDEELATVLSEERLKSEAKAKKLNEEREKLKVNLEDLRRETQRRMQRMLEAQQAQLREENEYIAQKTLEDQQVQLQRQYEQIRVLQRDHSLQTRTRSHPGPNCIQECRSISLVGDCFYFCGPKANDSNLPQYVTARIGDQKFNDNLEQRTHLSHAVKRTIQSWVGHTGGVKAFVLGTSSSFYIHYHQDGQCKDMSFLPDYPGLAAFLNKYRKPETADSDKGKSASTESGCPRYVSLGVNGHYYLRTTRRLAWDLPGELKNEPWYSESKVKAVWLGMKDAWVAQLKNGERRYNLQGQYSGNSGKLKENIERGFGPKRPGQRIKAMALNLTNPESFACVWGNGGIIYNDAGEFDGFIFEEFATKNFGTNFN